MPYLLLLPGQSLRISERQFGTARVLDLHGPLVGREAADRLSQTIARHLQSADGVLVVNLAAVPEIDWDGLYVLNKAERATRRGGASVRMTVPGNGHRSLMLGRARALLDCFESVEDALADVRASMGRGRIYRYVTLCCGVWAERLRRLLPARKEGRPSHNDSGFVRSNTAEVGYHAANPADDGSLLRVVRRSDCQSQGR
jgi:ABC-type transporter Mla MlaB component